MIKIRCVRKIKIKALDNIDDASLPFYEQNEILLSAILEWGIDGFSYLEDYISSVRFFLGGSLQLNKAEINIIPSCR